MSSEVLKYNLQLPESPITTNKPERLGRGHRIKNAASGLKDGMNYIAVRGGSLCQATLKVARSLLDNTAPPLVTDLEPNPNSPIARPFEDNVTVRVILEELRHPTSSERVIESGIYEDLFTKMRMNGGIIATNRLTDWERIAMEQAGGHLDESGKVMIVEALANQAPVIKPLSEPSRIRNLYTQAEKNGGILPRKGLQYYEADALETLGGRSDSSGEVLIFE